MAVTEISSIYSSLQTIIENEGFSELNIKSDIGKNSYKGASNKYAIIVGPSNEDEGVGVVKSSTYRVPFSITLTNKYNRTLTDENSSVKTYELQQKAMDIYKTCVGQRINQPTIVVDSQNFAVVDIQVLEDDRICSVSFTFDAIIRISF